MKSFSIGKIEARQKSFAVRLPHKMVETCIATCRLLIRQCALLMHSVL